MSLCCSINGVEFMDAYHFSVRIKQLGWPFNDSKGFFKISKSTERDGAYIYNLICHNNYCFRLMRDWKLANLANGKDISTGPF